MSTHLEYSQMEQTKTPSVVSSTDETIRRPNRMSRIVYSTYIPNKRFSRYNNALLSLLPVRRLNSSDLSVEKANVFSFLTFHWILRYLRSNPKYPDELPLCPKMDSCRVNSPRLDGIFNNEAISKGKVGMSMICVLWTFIKTRTCFACVLYILASILSMGGVAEFIPRIIDDIGNLRDAYIGIAGLVLTELFAFILFSWSNAINLRTAIRLRSACFSSLFRQVLMSSLTYKVSSWQLISFLLTDGKHIHDLVMAIPNLLCTPFILACFMAFAGAKLNIWGYMSVAIIVLLFPIFIMAALMSKKCLQKASFFSNERVKLLEEFIVNNIYVKFFKQEESFKKHISAKRQKELEHFSRAELFDNLCISFVQLQPLLSISALFIAYNLDGAMNLPMFAAICIILIIHMKQLLDNFWNGLNSFIKGRAALNKFKTIMLFDTINSERKLKPTLDNIAICIEEANFQWTRQETLDINAADYIAYTNYSVKFKNNIAIHDVLTDVTMTVEKGSLIGICGLPESGTSSLLLAIMGLILKSKGERRTVGTFAYVKQDPVILNDTLANNITFGNDMDTTRYYRTLNNCDLLNISFQTPGIENVIDPKLLTMQQKQCIALARAMYSDGDIYLLDNPFSALEYYRKLTIFDHFRRSLEGKTILIVTDQTEFLEQCNEVYMLKKGKIAMQGTHEYLLKYEPDYQEFIDYLKKHINMCRIKSKLFETEEEIPSTPISTVRKHSTSVFGSKTSLTSYYTQSENMDFVDGELQDSTMSSMFKQYVCQFGIMSMIFVFFAQIVNSTLTLFLPIYYIITVGEDIANNIWKISLYFGLFFTIFFIDFIMNFFYNKKMFQVSAIFHDEILEKLYHATLSFFQSTSLGIIAKLSLHLHLTDTYIPGLIHSLCLNIFLMLMTTLVLILILQWFSIVMIVILVVMVVLTIFVSKAILRYNEFLLDTTDKLYSQVITMLKARPVIQAYAKTHDFIYRLYNDYDEYLTYTYIFEAGKSWLNFLLQSLSVLFLAVGFIIINHSTFPEIFGVNFLYVIVFSVLQVCFAIQKSLLKYVDVKTAFDTLNAVQQLKMNITEELDVNVSAVNEDKIQEKVYSVDFSDVSLETERPVLENMTFKVKGNEKMGFVGLTNCERKAIIALLYRLNSPTSGIVMIGSENITRYQISDVRSLVSIIPSDPYLFNITIRKMLNTSLDQAIDILKQVRLWDRVEQLPKNIDSPVDQYFGSEEKQLLCLAQAHLKQSLILVIEDVINDSTLEYILNTKLQSLFPNTTVLVFTNGVSGLKACNRIAFVEKGKVSKIGSTKQMLANLGSQYTIFKPVLSEICVLNIRFKMKYCSCLFILLLIGEAQFTDIEEVSVSVELLGMDLEDQCGKLADAQKQVLLSKKNAFIEQIAIEEEYGRFTREQAKDLKERYVDSDLDLSPIMKRQWSIIQQMGDVYLPEENWDQLIKFKNTAAQLSDEVRVICFNKTDNCTLSRKDVRHLYATSRNAKELQEIWSTCQDTFVSSSTEYADILKLVPVAAEANDVNNAKEYWEMLVEHPDAYETADSIWQEIKPLYVKFHKFIKTRLERHYPEIKNSENIPVFLLGSEFGTDWSNIAPLILPHRYLYDEITSMLDFDNIGGQKAYEIAERFTTSLGLPKLRQMFWKTSTFSEQCPAHLLTYCSDRFSQVITCNSTGWVEYLDAHETMVRAALYNLDYSTATYSAFRVSALDEALASLSSILAVKNLPLVGIVPEDIFFNDNGKNEIEMTALLLTALRVLPRLPYYLLADTWRLQQLENPAVNMSASWWTERESVQLVKGVTNTEWDVLGDPYMTSNKPYIGKFLGTVLQFQILDYFQSDADNGINILTRMAQDENFRLLLQQRALYDWPKVLHDNFYYEVAADELLQYFKPLEEYMDKAPEMQVTQTVRPKTTTVLPTPTTVPPPTSTLAPTTVVDAKPVRDEPVNVLRKDSKPMISAEEVVLVDKVPEPIRPREHAPEKANWTGTWIGVTVGVGSLAIIVGIVARRRLRKRPIPKNRRNDV
ncbi:Multidrug-Resistance like Protein 1 [Carabus blaptoides fortunei]